MMSVAPAQLIIIVLASLVLGWIMRGCFELVAHRYFGHCSVTEAGYPPLPRVIAPTGEAEGCAPLECPPEWNHVCADCGWDLGCHAWGCPHYVAAVIPLLPGECRECHFRNLTHHADCSRKPTPMEAAS